MVQVVYAEFLLSLTEVQDIGRGRNYQLRLTKINQVHSFHKKTTHKVAENFWTAHDRFYPSWGSSTASLFYDSLQLKVLHTGRLMIQSARYSRYRTNYYPQQEKKFRQPPAHFLKMGKLSGIEAAVNRCRS
ncbi:hypothetical protein T265_05288 [Opisthorchis viverrini]|uniref:Uncharacterized protein n=1 Tax=Opisthorchis viverrini TaxID=6198 RepID=A0A074ZPK7_OPIVI|nr:hypothetical protein T265_05288 [Opisthorchis viverrini]KER27732.1 hypothetical protein T265_05288 [Opisthorchis viverrini]